MPKGLVDNEMEKRLQIAMDGVYGNEAFTSDLDDLSADTFLKWAAARVAEIVSVTEGMDDQTAEAAMYPRLKALRRFARHVNEIASGSSDRAALVGKLFEQAREIYGKDLSAVLPDVTAALAAIPQDEPVLLIQALQHFFEGDVDDRSTDQQPSAE